MLAEFSFSRKTRKRNWPNVQSSWPNKLGQQRIYCIYISKVSRFVLIKDLIMRAGRESLLCLQQNKPSRVVYVFFGLTVFCRFLRLYRRYCPQITNFVSLLHATFFSAGSRQAIPSGQDGSMMPSWVANQNTVFLSVTVFSPKTSREETLDAVSLKGARCVSGQKSISFKPCPGIYLSLKVIETILVFANKAK